MQVGSTETRLDVLVHGNRAPSAVAGAVSEVECESPSGAAVALDASGSTDPDSVPEVFEDIVSYDWFEVDPATGEWVAIGAGEQLIAQLALGSHDLRVRVTDHAGASVPVRIEVAASDSCGNVAVALVSVESNAPQTHPIDRHQRGGPPPDILGAEIGTDDREMLLRAEQNPRGPRRTYTLLYSATDVGGNQTLARLGIPVWLPRSPFLLWLRMLRGDWQ